jgi:hypothetical protein
MFRIPKINYLDPDVFNIHRGKILTRYDEEITRLYAHTRGKLRSVTREFEDLQHRLRTRLQEVPDTELPFSRKRFVMHNIQRCRCKFCKSWNGHRAYCKMFEEIEQMEKNVYHQDKSYRQYLWNLRTTEMHKLEEARLKQLVEKRLRGNNH